MNMTEQIFRVVIPEEEETQVKDGKAKTTVKNIPWICFSGINHDR